MDSLIASIPKRRLATIDEIVPAYVFLASDEARHFVGQCLSPNGGDVML
jgi:3-oxoacyl-[acyl-carrier protein] reductase